MNGWPYWDALVWALVGLVGGAMLGRWTTARTPFVLALICAVLGALAVPAIFVLRGADGVVPAVEVMLATVPLTLGLAVGGALAVLLARWRGRPPRP